MRGSRQFVKVCDVADFTDPELCRAIGEIEAVPAPRALVERKQWERAMLALVLEAEGRLGGDASVLAIGAGTEPVLFWLANRTGRVTATDVYGEGKFSAVEAAGSMLEDPAAFSPVGYRRDHLEVRHMDARHLEFGDASFDVAYSLSAIEHFGSPEDIARSAAEMGRVLKPGGLAVVVTECLLHLSPLDSAAAESAIRLVTFGRKRRGATLRRRVALGEAFTPGELQRRIVGPSGLRLLQPLDLSISTQSWDNVTVVHPGGRLETATGRLHPHVLIRISRRCAWCCKSSPPHRGADLQGPSGSLAPAPAWLGGFRDDFRLSVGRRVTAGAAGAACAGGVLGEPFGADRVQREHDFPPESPRSLLPKRQLADQDIAVGNRLATVITHVLFPDDDSHSSPPVIWPGLPASGANSSCCRAPFYPQGQKRFWIPVGTSEWIEVCANTATLGGSARRRIAGYAAMWGGRSILGLHGRKSAQLLPARAPVLRIPGRDKIVPQSTIDNLTSLGYHIGEAIPTRAAPVGRQPEHKEEPDEPDRKRHP